MALDRLSILRSKSAKDEKPALQQLAATQRRWSAGFSLSETSPCRGTPHFTRFLKPAGSSTVLWLVLVAGALSAAEPEAKPTDFVRFVEDAHGASLQTGIGSYEKDGVVVDLVGAVHIADKAYFAALNARFAGYESVLYELVGPPMEERERLQVGNGDKRLSGLGAIQDLMRNTLGLESQLAAIDYRAKNFVHADMGTDQFFETQERKGESFLGLWWKAIRAQAEAAETAPARAQPGLAKLLEILCRKDSSTELKRLIGREFDMVEQIVAGVEGGDGTVIIGERNRVALEVLAREVKAGKKSLAVFYGAAHLPDMEKRLIQQGYKLRHMDWLKAWDLPPEPVDE